MEPQKVVGNYENARDDEVERGQGDQGPRAREVLEIDDVAEYGEDNVRQRKGLGKV